MQITTTYLQSNSTNTHVRVIYGTKQTSRLIQQTRRPPTPETKQKSIQSMEYTIHANANKTLKLHDEIRVFHF